MARDYKIYINDTFLLITAQPPQMNEKFNKVLTEERSVLAFVKQPNILYSEEMTHPIVLVSEQTDELLQSLINHTDLVTAGGGIVCNEHDELLLIYRRGKWDLPKGKIESGEQIMDGAIREVAEETGIEVAETMEPAIITYHAYKLKNKNCLKQTYWFRMKAGKGKQKLKPQTEEDIEKALWVPRYQLSQYRQGCFPLIWDLIKGYSISK